MPWFYRQRRSDRKKQTKVRNCGLEGGVRAGDRCRVSTCVNGSESLIFLVMLVMWLKMESGGGSRGIVGQRKLKSQVPISLSVVQEEVGSY